MTAAERVPDGEPSGTSPRFRRLAFLGDAVHIYWFDGWRARHPQLTRRQALASFAHNIKEALRG